MKTVKLGKLIFTQKDETYQACIVCYGNMRDGNEDCLVVSKRQYEEPTRALWSYVERSPDLIISKPTNYETMIHLRSKMHKYVFFGDEHDVC